MMKSKTRLILKWALLGALACAVVGALLFGISAIGASVALPGVGLIVAGPIVGGLVGALLGAFVGFVVGLLAAIIFIIIRKDG
jgi:uncharacterized membrane protein